MHFERLTLSAAGSRWLLVERLQIQNKSDLLDALFEEHLVSQHQSAIDKMKRFENIRGSNQ